MLIYAVFAALILLLPIAGLFPPVEWQGTTVENRIFTIEMRPRVHQKYGPGGARFKPVFAQELVEWWLAWAGALVIAAPIAVIAAMLAPQVGLPSYAGGAFAVLASMIAWQWRTTDWGRRQIEYVGWSAEMLMAEQQGFAGYEGFDFVDTLRRGYTVFNGMDNDEVAAGLARWRWLAGLLIALLAVGIRRAK